MSRRYTRLVILCEDQQHEVFVRRYLSGIGYKKRVYVERPPPGSQDAMQYVLDRFAVEVRACRNKGSYQNVGLVTVIDADTGSVENRFTQLDAKLEKHELPKRAPGEPVVILVPRRNIETWIHYLLGNQVDEESEYRKLRRPGGCQPAVDRLLTFREKSWILPEDCPPSLKHGCHEVRRIEDRSEAAC